MGNRLWAGIPSRYVTSHLVKLSLLLSVGREMNTDQSALMCSSWGIKAGWLIPFMDKRVVAGKYVWFFINSCHSEHLRGDFSRKGATQTFCFQLQP